MNILGELLESSVADDGKLYDMGVEVGKLYTDHGLPIDMALERIEGSKEKKLAVLNGALHWLVLHKRNSGAPEKAIDRQRAQNIKYVERFLAGKEIGAY